VLPLPETPVGAPGAVEGTTADDAEDAVLVPFEFVAVTVNVYEVPFVRPDTVHDVVAVVHWNPPGDEVTVYPVMASPPLLDGAVHDTTDCAFAPPVAKTPVGGCGAPNGMIAEEAVDAGESPAELVAFTVNVYETPPVSPVTVQLVAVVVVQVKPPGDEVAVYPVIAESPLLVGAVHDTTDCVVSPVVAETPVGEPGGCLTSAETAADMFPIPRAFVAVTRNV